MKDKVTKSRDTVPLGKIGITTTKNRSTNLKGKCHEIYNALFINIKNSTWAP